jgi:ParB/RepB/Spo0J family partition protein
MHLPGVNILYPFGSGVNGMKIDLQDDLFKPEGASPALQAGTSIAPVQGVAERSIVVGNAVTPMTAVNGVPIGRSVGSLMMVWVKQLRLPDDSLRRSYAWESDTNFPELMESIRQTGNCNIDPILCEITNELTEVEGEQRPVLLVRAGVRRFWALTNLQAPEALVRVLPVESQVRMTTLVSLITNEMREPLSILDKADVIHLLLEDYGLRQHVVASYVGYSQSMVSRLNMLAIQPPMIKTFVSNESLSLGDLEQLNKRFREDEDLRELAARYIVFTQGKVSVNDLANQIAPPIGEPTAHLSLNNDTVQLIPLGDQPGQQVPSPALRLTPEKKGLPYWKRSMPLFAVPARIIQNHHPVQVTGSSDAPKVRAESLHIIQFLEQFKREREFDIAALEEAMLCDQEAIREALESK